MGPTRHLPAATRFSPAWRRVLGRMLGVPLLLAISASGVYAGINGVRPDFAFGVAIASVIGAYRLVRGRPLFEEEEAD